MNVQSAGLALASLVLPVPSRIATASEPNQFLAIIEFAGLKGKTK